MKAVALSVSIGEKRLRRVKTSTPGHFAAQTQHKSKPMLKENDPTLFSEEWKYLNSSLIEASYCDKHLIGVSNRTPMGFESTASSGHLMLRTARQFSYRLEKALVRIF